MPKVTENDVEVTLETGKHKGRIVQIVRHKKPAKTKRLANNKLDKNFRPPDGGWGWMVAIAAGVSLLSTFPILQQFGILFRTRFTNFGFSSSQIVTLINAQQAASALIGIFSNPLYRTFSYRQISFLGAFLITLGLVATFFSKSYISYFLSITLLYGFGKGFIFSASSQAINSYFDTKRRSAMTLMSTIAGLGPMFLPFVATFLMVQYGVTGAVLFYIGLSLHNFICSFIFQPVQKHAKKLKGERLAENLRILQIDKPPIVPNNGQNGLETCVTQDSDKTYTLITSNNGSFRGPKSLETSPAEEIKFLLKPREEFIRDEQQNQSSLFTKIVDYLHLDLLKDFTYFNLALGLTVIEFTENNFASVLPFILSEFRFSNYEIATCMSMLGSCDQIMKFFIPHTVGKLKCDKRVIMIVSCMLICAARVVVGQTRKVPIALVCFAVMGTNKAIRVAYGNMILSGYVAPKKLSDAIALERTIMGVFSLCSAPIIGMIPDATSYGFFVLSMNGMCVIVGILWFGEDLVRWCIRKLKKSPAETEIKTVEI
ncbi:monocarboxylate transporter 9-like isoform X2 [Episyrphus balteatus]|uniref:monocarboxylate transporter 9-like isoform X2 n=1 Tax=Episyrphus balteatus TaxID=286459 RepID=UPI0024863C21|nr:monocarboxylate transporter 9-like isoform X2 [Episyrphus balteatus]